jgi:hypothetical protein
MMLGDELHTAHKKQQKYTFYTHVLKVNIKGRSPSNGELSDFSFYIDSQKSAHRKFKK